MKGKAESRKQKAEEGEGSALPERFGAKRPGRVGECEEHRTEWGTEGPQASGLLFEALARLVSYPEGDYLEALDRAIGSSAGFPELLALLEQFQRVTAGWSFDDFEEEFTRTFDLNPVAALDLGWHLWGDTYERGRFLATVRGLLAEHQISESTELPDHLSHILRVLARLDRERADELMGYVRPALAKVLAALPSEHPYRCLVIAIESLFDQGFPVREGEGPRDFANPAATADVSPEVIR